MSNWLVFPIPMSCLHHDDEARAEARLPVNNICAFCTPITARRTGIDLKAKEVYHDQIRQRRVVLVTANPHDPLCPVLERICPRVFAETKGFLETLTALVLHLVPTFLVVVLLVFAWRRELIGVIAFAGLAIADVFVM